MEWGREPKFLLAERSRDIRGRKCKIGYLGVEVYLESPAQLVQPAPEAPAARPADTDDPKN